MKKVLLKDIPCRIPRFNPPPIGGFARDENGDIIMHETAVNYRRELTSIVLGTPVGQHFTIAQMRHANTLIKQLEATPTNCAMFLEDDVWRYLCQALDAAGFSFPNEGIEKMIDDVKAAPTENPPPKPEQVPSA